MKAADTTIMKKHVMLLRENFDTVQIFCTRHENGGYTVNATEGRGNWFARLGQVADWLRRETDASQGPVPDSDEEA